MDFFLNSKEILVKERKTLYFFGNQLLQMHCYIEATLLKCLLKLTHEIVQ